MSQVNAVHSSRTSTEKRWNRRPGECRRRREEEASGAGSRARMIDQADEESSWQQGSWRIQRLNRAFFRLLSINVSSDVCSACMVFWFCEWDCVLRNSKQLCTNVAVNRTIGACRLCALNRETNEQTTSLYGTRRASSCSRIWPWRKEGSFKFR